MPTSNRKRHASSLLLLCLAAVCALTLPGVQARAVTFTQVSSTEWDASNGIISMAMNPTNFDITKLSVTLNGVTTNWLDASYGVSPFGHAIGLYNLYSYDNPSGTRGTVVAGYHNGGSYVDMWVDKPHIAGTDPLDVENHWVIRDGDAGIHFYQVLRHTAADAATNLGAATTNFFPSSNAITQSNGTTLMYQKNTGPNNMGTITSTFPTSAYTASVLAAGPGRQVQAETVDYTASGGLGTYLSQTGLNREFITKYNYGTYAQFHVAHGYIGAKNAFWWVVPSNESINGGPTKQLLSGVQVEYQSAHLGGQNITFAAGEVATHIYGPFCLYFNSFDSTKTTNDQLYNDAAGTVASDLAFYDNDGILTADGYRKQANRVTVTAHIRGSKWSTTTNNNVIVLSDNNTYFQESANGYQYWASADSSGNASITGVRPGTYRLTAYSLGTWGLYHIDNVVVGTTAVTVNGDFSERNFSSQAPIWTIGTPDRSAHEFSHGHGSNGFDNKEYLGRWNYWADLAANNGKVVYTVGTSNVGQVPFVQYNHFYPNLYAGVYGGSTTEYNGYDYITPDYVKTGAAAQGVTPANYSSPAWEFHFKTTSAQNNQGAYVLVTIALAGNDHASLQVRLNGTHTVPLKWYPPRGTNPEQRSGVSGYNNYAVFQFNTADLNTVGSDNVLTIFSSGSTLYDAIKMEIGPSAADPSISGWPEYDWVYYDAADASATQSASAP